MNAIIPSFDNSTQTMSSLDFLNEVINPARETAGEKSVENRHFITRIEDELDDLGVAEKFYVTTSQGAKREVKGYHLTFDQMLLVGMRESKAVRRKVQAKLKELQEQTAEGFRVPGTMAEALRLAADQAEQIEAQQIQIKLMTPAAELGERVAESDRSVMRFVRTLPGVNTQQVQKKLASLGYLYKRQGTWRVKRSKTRYFDERLIKGVKVEVKIIATGEGQKLLASLYNTGRLPMRKNCRVEMVSFDNHGTLTHIGKQGNLL